MEATDSSTFRDFPTGLPPYFNVSAQSDPEHGRTITTLDGLGSPPSVYQRNPWRRAVGRGPSLGCDGHD